MNVFSTGIKKVFFLFVMPNYHILFIVVKMCFSLKIHLKRFTTEAFKHLLMLINWLKSSIILAIAIVPPCSTFANKYAWDNSQIKQITYRAYPNSSTDGAIYCPSRKAWSQTDCLLSLSFPFFHVSIMLPELEMSQCTCWGKTVL